MVYSLLKSLLLIAIIDFNSRTVSYFLTMGTIDVCAYTRWLACECTALHVL